MNTKQQYSISHWPDTEELQKRLYRLANELPIHQVRRDKMDEYLNYFETKCAGSKKMTDRAKELIPGGVQHNLAFNYPFPLAITKADGAYLWDVDGNRYIDFLQAGGPTLLGSNYKPVQEKVIEVIRESGPGDRAFPRVRAEACRADPRAHALDRDVPHADERHRGDAWPRRARRAVSPEKNTSSRTAAPTMAGATSSCSECGCRGSAPLTRTGYRQGAYQFTKEVFPNDIDALQKRMEENEKDGGTAAVFLEPLGPESGTRPVLRDFNKKVRELCDRFGTLLVFDEVVTGFRVGLGGAQGYFNVKPDLTVFGKCVAGGYPGAGGVGGRKDVMSCYAAGLAGGPGGKRAIVGGTLSANPLSCAAGYFAIKAIEETGAHIKAGAAGDRLSKGLADIFERNKLPFVSFNHGSICHMETGAAMLMDIKNPNIFKEVGLRKKVMEEMGAALMAEGIVTLAGSRLYSSMADTDDVIDDALSRLDRLFKHIEVKQN